MASAGGKEVGRVSIRVVPNTDGFREKVERDLGKGFRDVKVRVEPEIDEDKLQRDMKRAAGRADQHAEVELDVDDKDLNKKLRRVNDMVKKGPKVDLGIEREIAKFRKELDEAFSIDAELNVTSMEDELRRITKGARRDYEIEVDPAKFRESFDKASRGAKIRARFDESWLKAQADAAVRKLQGLDFRVRARVELARAEAQLARDKAEALFREIQARISVKTAPFIAKCRAAAKAASAGLKVTAKMDVDTQSLKGVMRGVGSAANFLQRPIYKVFGGQVFEDAIRNFTRIKGVLASITMGASAALVPIAAMGSSLGSAAVAAAKLAGGLAPAMFATAAVGITSMAKSFSGFADVVKASNLDELNEALVGMGPAAQRGARGVYELKTAFSNASAGAQEAFWSGIKTDFNDLSPLALSAAASVTKVSEAAGEAAGRLTEFFASSQGMSMFDDLMTSASHSAANLAEAFMGAIPGITAVGAAAGPILADLTSKIEGVANAWSDRMVGEFESGELQRSMQEMRGQVESVMSVFSDMGAIISGVWSAAAASGEQFLGPMREAVASTREWVESAEGVNALQGYFQSMGEVVSAMSPIFGEIAQTIVGTVIPAMADFLTAAAPGMQQFTQGFSDLIGQLAPFASAVGEIFGSIVGAIGGVLPHLAALVPVIFAVFGAFQLWSQIGGFIAPLISLIGGLTFPILAVVGVVALVVAAFATVNGAFEGLRAAAEPMISSFQQIGVALMQFGQSIWTSLQPAFAAIVPVITNFVGLISDIVAALTPVVIVVFQTAAAIVGALMPVFVALMPAVNAVVSVLRSLVQALAPILSIVVMVAGAFLQLLAAILGFVASALAAILSFVASVIAGFVSMVSSVIAVVGGWVATIVAFFVSLATSCISFVVNMWSQVVGAFSAGVGQAVSVVSRMPGMAKSALGNVGSLLVSSGKALIQGFINGIKSMLGAVRDAASSVVQAARDFFPFSPAKRGPFSGRGYTTYSGKALVKDFSKGMLSEKGSVAAAANEVLGAAQGRIHQANKDKILQPVLESNARKIAESRKRERDAEEQHNKRLEEIRKEGGDVAAKTAEENEKHAENLAKIRKDLDESLEAPDYSKMDTSFKEYWVGGLTEVLKQELDNLVQQQDLSGRMRRESLRAVQAARSVFGDQPIFAKVEANVNAEHFDWAVQNAIDEAKLYEVPVTFVAENLKEFKDFLGMGDGAIPRAIDAAMEWNWNNTDANRYRENGKSEVHYHVEDMQEAIRLEQLRERKQMMRMV